MQGSLTSGERVNHDERTDVDYNAASDYFLGRTDDNHDAVRENLIQPS